MRVAIGSLVATVAAALIIGFGPKAKYTLDGYDYAIVMLMDRGASYAQAQSQAQAFYAHQPIAKMPEYARWLGGKPEYWELFSVRTVYPALASILYPWRGFEALVDVSRASYIAVAVLVVVLCSRFAPVPWSVALSVAFDLFPGWRDLSRVALTDALAVALCTATLIAAIAYLQRGYAWRMFSFTLLCGVLTFTRPVGYIVAGAAVIAAVIALRRKNNERAIRAGALAAVAAAWSIAAMLALQSAHAPGLGWIFADTYAHFVAAGYAAPGQNLVHWYGAEELLIARLALRDAVVFVLPLFAIVGIALERRRPDATLLAGACIATWFGAIVDPDRYDMIRCVVLPIAPAMLALASAGIWRTATLIPRALGPATHVVRHAVPMRSLLRKDTVKEQ